MWSVKVLLSAIHPWSPEQLIGVMWVTEGSEKSHSCLCKLLFVALTNEVWELTDKCLFRKSHTKNLTEFNETELGTSPEVQSKVKCPTTTTPTCHGYTCGLMLHQIYARCRLPLFFPAAYMTLGWMNCLQLQRVCKPVCLCLNSLIQGGTERFFPFTHFQNGEAYLMIADWFVVVVVVFHFVTFSLWVYFK